ncbi:TPA: hypothetical protein ACGJ07_005420 [Pseudomonas aeruginosa]|uniref:hypothetical protein n=1 Tax=Pseudomonas aeruginosa TaxID=287 RepID=UPI00053E1810|nr:hypothetical protein [Pseudomonas aeruginosa]
MEQAMRDEFEAVYPLPDGMERNGESYTGGEMWWLWEERWQVWQRSRAALRVDLPEPYAFHQEVQTVFRDRVKEALQQAGIEVKL